MDMKTPSEMEHMAQVARRAAGWDPADMTQYRPIDVSVEGGGDWDQAVSDRAYAEGVEAGLLWALGVARMPLPR